MVPLSRPDFAESSTPAVLTERGFVVATPSRKGRADVLLLLPAPWFAAALLLPCLALATPSLRYAIDASLDPEAGTLTGTVEIMDDGQLLDPATTPLLLYPNRFAVPDPDLNDVNYPGRYPYGISTGGITAAAAADGRSIAFSLAIPERFGPFGRVDGQVTLLGGWHPQVRPAEPPDLTAHMPPAAYELRLTVTRSGLLVFGSEMVRVAARKPVTVALISTSSPLLCFLPDYAVIAGHADGRTDVNVAVAASRAGRIEWGERVAAALEDALGAFDLRWRLDVPLTVVQAPLRETLAIPFPGGLLVSDLLFDVAPLRKLERQHEDALFDAAAGSLLMAAGASLHEALTGGRLLLIWRWEKGAADPEYVRDLFRKGEVIGLLDRIGTDPQTHFETTLFFSPQLPSELRWSPPFSGRDVPSPLSAAWGISRTFGWPRTLDAVRQTLDRRTGLYEALASRASPDELHTLQALLRPHRVDFRLGDAERMDDGWSVEVCSDEDAGIPVEVLARTDAGEQRVVASCPDACCTAAVVGNGEVPDLEVDPGKVWIQQTDEAADPRRNDRNFLDLKWMLARPAFAWPAGDSIPTASIELTLQPRYDLANAMFVLPTVTSSRLMLYAGYRLGLGSLVRPNQLAWTLDLGGRVAASTDESQGVSFGPSIVWHFTDRQSRINPYEGSYFSGYILPLASEEGQQLGLRTGMVFSQLFGRTPDHVFAVRVAADTNLGDLPAWEAPSTGGPFGMRALGANEIYALHRGCLSIEYRFTPIRNLSWPLLDLAFLNAIQLAVFAESAVMSEQPSDLFTKRRLYADAGLALRPLFNAFGVMPSILSLDLAWLLPVGAVDQPRPALFLAFYQPM